MLFTLWALLVSGCGEDPLRGLGEAGAWIDEPEPPSTTAARPTAQPVTFVHISSITWWNDGYGGSAFDGRDEVIARVAERRAGTDRFIQASRWEIAAVLPLVVVPARVPFQVETVTSQLVLDPVLPQLHPSTYAAFGYWTTEPYSSSRREAQLATLTVGPAQPEEITSCEPPACRVVDLGGQTLLQTQGALQTTWNWQEAGLAYELAVRAAQDEVALEMIASTEPLADLVSVPRGALDS